MVVRLFVEFDGFLLDFTGLFEQFYEVFLYFRGEVSSHLSLQVVKDFELDFIDNVVSYVWLDFIDFG